MPKTSTPASELQDAVSSAVIAFMKSATHALTAVEEANLEEIRRVEQEVRDAQRERDELRRERDALVKEKADTAVDLEAVRSEAERWRVASEKADWMINHQAETIAQLRIEAQQWKDQFMRVDDERQRLSARNDELVSQQLYAAHRRDAYYQAQEPLTPRSQGPAQVQGTSSTRAASSNHYASSSMPAPANGYLTDGDVLSRQAARDRTYTRQQQQRQHRVRDGRTAAAASSSRHTHDAQQQQSISAPTQSKVLRTVHVVMQGGTAVKEESIDSVALNSVDTGAGTRGSESLGDEEEELGLEKEGVEPRSPAMHSHSQRRRESGTTGKGKQKAVAARSQNAARPRRRWSEGRRVYDDDDDSDGFISSVSVSVSASEEEDADEYVPSPLKDRARLDDEDEDEDELMLGGGAQKKQPVGLRTPARRAQTQPTAPVKSGSSTVRKRNSPYPTTVATGKRPRNR